MTNLFIWECSCMSIINTKYPNSFITAKVIGAAMEVHNNIGCGFQELIYQRALALEMENRGISYTREVKIDVLFKGIIVGTRRVDFLIENNICLEIKAVKSLEKVHLAQAINYLEAFSLKIGLLINFGETKLKFHRITNKKSLRH